MSLLHSKLLLDQRRELRRPTFGRAGDVEPLAKFCLRDQQKHHDRHQAVAPVLGPDQAPAGGNLILLC